MTQETPATTATTADKRFYDKLTIKEWQMVDMGISILGWLILLALVLNTSSRVKRLFWESDLTNYLRENKFKGTGRRRADKDHEAE